MMKLKINTLILMFLVSMPITAQTSEQLTKKYGSPISETYKIGPDTIAAFDYTYGKNDQLCSISVTPSLESKVKVFDNALIDELVKGLAPENRRGRNIINGFISSIEFPGTVEDFVNVVITRITHHDDKARGEYSSISVRWINKDCENKNFWNSLKN